MMNRTLFRIVRGLSKTQPGLDDKTAEIDRLLFTECQTDCERGLILELLERFIYFSGDAHSQLLIELAESIVTDPDLVSGTTQIVSMTGDNSSDSGQYVLYIMKARLEINEWREHLAINRFGLSYKEFKRNGCVHKDIVLVDEFVGSGQTVIGRVAELRKVYKDFDNISIRVKALVSSKIGLTRVRDEGINIESLVQLDKGISDHYEPDIVLNKLALMDRLESTLSTSYNERQLPKLGFGSTECLYARYQGNTPNSVFPIFWWPFRSVLIWRSEKHCYLGLWGMLSL